MRILVFAALLSDVLWSQTAPVQSPGPDQATTPAHAPAFATAQQGQEPLPFLLPYHPHLLSRPPSTFRYTHGNGDQTSIAVKPNEPATPRLAPLCAVPLTNVKPPNGSNPDRKM